MSGFKQQPTGFSTKAIHVGQDPEQWSHLAVVPPLVTSTTFKQFSPAEPLVNIFSFFQIIIFIFLQCRPLHKLEKIQIYSIISDKLLHHNKSN